MCFDRNADLLREIELLLLLVRQKFVQRRIEKTNRCRQSIERLENAGEIFPLIRKQFGQRLDARRLVLGQDHFAHRVDPIALEKHVLGATKTDPFGAKRDRILDLLGRVGVGAHIRASRARSTQLINFAYC